MKEKSSRKYRWSKECFCKYDLKNSEATKDWFNYIEKKFLSRKKVL